MSVLRPIRLIPARAPMKFLVALAAGLVLILFAGSNAASAAEVDAPTPPPLEYSRDGTTWSSNPPSSVFRPGITLVPGDATSTTLYLRSTATIPGTLTSAIRSPRTSTSDAARAFGLAAISANNAEFPRTPISDLPLCTPLGSALVLEPGESTKITLTADLDSQITGTTAQNTSFDFQLALNFAQTVADSVPDDAACAPGSQEVPGIPPVPSETTSPPQASERPLPRTGAETAGILIIAALVIGTGTAFILATRRREKS